MRKILSLLLIGIFVLCQCVNADIYARPKIANAGTGLTFLMKTTDSSVNADWSAGDPSATFTAARTATARGTYMDINGHANISTTANVGRYDYGYHDLTGWHLWGDGLPRLVLETTSTNLLNNGQGTFGSNTLWEDGSGSDNLHYSGTDRWSMAIQGGCATTNTINTTDYIYNRSIQIAVTTATNNATNIQLRSSNFSITSGTKYTISFYAKSTVAATISIYFNLSVNPWTGYATEGTQSVTIPANTWVRVIKTVTANATVADCSIAMAFDNNGVHTMQFDCIQVEARKSASTWIPSTGAADNVRPGETLTYAVLNNFLGGDNGTVLLKMALMSLPSEASSDYGTYWVCQPDGTNQWKMGAETMSGGKVTMYARSTAGNADIASINAPARYVLTTMTWAYSTTAVGGKAQSCWIDNTTLYTSTDYFTPVGALPAAMGLLSDFGSVWIEELAIFSTDLRAQGNARTNAYNAL